MCEEGIPELPEEEEEMFEPFLASVENLADILLLIREEPIVLKAVEH
jgi:hypothetical protein